jgi:hypothetical protein
VNIALEADMARYITLALLILMAGCIDTRRAQDPFMAQVPTDSPDLGASGDAQPDAPAPTDPGSSDIPEDTAPDEPDIPPDESTTPDTPQQPDEGTSPDNAGPDEGTVADAGCDECPSQGDTTCDGNDILLCNFVDGCLKWVATETCDGNDGCSTSQCDNGECVFAPALDGTPCESDGNACTLDVCQSGVCQNLGRAPVEIPESVTAEAIKATDAGTVYVVGSEEWAAGFDPSPWAGRIGSVDFLWEDTFMHTDGFDVGWNAGSFHDVDVTADGGAVFAGSIKIGSVEVDGFLYQVTPSGTEVFEASYGNFSEGIVSVVDDGNGFLVIGGGPWMRFRVGYDSYIDWTVPSFTSLLEVADYPNGALFAGPSESGGIKVIGTIAGGYEEWSWEATGKTFVEVGYGDGKIIVVGSDSSPAPWVAVLTIDGTLAWDVPIEDLDGLDTTAAEVAPDGAVYASVTDGTVSYVTKLNPNGWVDWQSQDLLGEFDALTTMPEGGLAALGSIDGILGTTDGTQKVFFFDQDGVACGF